MDIWSIIPVDPTEAMSSYSALLFIATAITCVFLHNQNLRQRGSIKALELDLSKKEKQLRDFTESEASVLHKKIEKALTTNSCDLKEVKVAMNRIDKTVVSLTSDMGHVTKTMDEIKHSVDKLWSK